MVRKLRQGYKLVTLLEEFEYGREKITTEDKQVLARLYVMPEYKSLVKLWNSGLLYIQTEIFRNPLGATVEDIKAVEFLTKIESLKLSLIRSYYRTYANPKKTQAPGQVEALIEDIEALGKIAKESRASEARNG